ncbi:uncharacterized protein LOC123541252 isoform X2 [Mercenaria mercenaria]|uniref:uncharacterized protein LOC123541252 isoform X2 n=1 Tax=Mercenaria mercenaria TaxID=6596 RepID=UPI00234E776A|nr:uncharacterized protein LOC123541252 isoform X2 [Mercenaria mercenaria]
MYACSLKALLLCHNILVYENSRRKDERRWWIFHVFSHQDVSAHTQVTVLEKQFYILLFHEILCDFYSMCYLIKVGCLMCFRLLSNFMQEFLSRFSNFIGFVIVLGILVVTAYYLLIQSSLSRNKRNSGIDNKQTQFKQELVIDKRSNSNQASVVNCQGNRKYWKWLTGLVFAAFLLTIPWEFIRLYQSAVAEKIAHMAAGTPAECIPEQMSVTQSVKSWLRWQFSWGPDPCQQYQKALLVDPLWHVTPSKVISSAFTHCIVYPVEILLGGLGRALRLFFSEIPPLWQPVMLVIIVIFCLLTLVMWFEYRIHLPLLFKFEPRTPVYLRNEERKTIKLKNERKNSKAIESNQGKVVRKVL